VVTAVWINLYCVTELDGYLDVYQWDLLCNRYESKGKRWELYPKSLVDIGEDVGRVLWEFEELREEGEVGEGVGGPRVKYPPKEEV
jgi:hypothetical protein